MIGSRQTSRPDPILHVDPAAGTGRKAPGRKHGSGSSQAANPPGGEPGSGGDEALDRLLALVAGGDRNALSALYSRTSAQLLGIVVRMLGRRDTSEEVLHDAFLRIWYSAPSFSTARGTPMSWMTAIVRNAALDRLRRQKREVPLDDLPDYGDRADEAPSPFERMAATLGGRALADCLDQLDAEQRGCLLLIYYHGLTHDELAYRLQRPIGTIKSWVRRSLIRLRACLEP